MQTYVNSVGKTGLAACAAMLVFVAGAAAQEGKEEVDIEIDKMSIPIHTKDPASGTWRIPTILTSGTCNGNGTNVIVPQSAKPVNIVMCRITKSPGGETREFLNRTIPGGDGFFTVGCSRDGANIYGYEVHWWDTDTNYFPKPITEGSTALTWSSHVLENGNQFKAVMVEVAKPNGQMETIRIDPKDAEPVPKSWSIMKAWYSYPYEPTLCNDGRG